jgi:hypothetical protein
VRPKTRFNKTVNNAGIHGYKPIGLYTETTDRVRPQPSGFEGMYTDSVGPSVRPKTRSNKTVNNAGIHGYKPIGLYTETTDRVRPQPSGIEMFTDSVGPTMRPKTRSTTVNTTGCHGYQPVDLYNNEPTETSMGFNPTRASTAIPRACNKPQLVKPTQFDGKSSWTDYIVQFEMVAELNQWDDRVKAMHLASSLRGVAQSVLGDLDRVARFNYESLTEALDRRFCAENKSELNKTLLKNRSRIDGESLPELSQALRRLAKHAYPEASFTMQDSLAKDQFLDAVGDSDLRWKIFQARPRTLDEALEIAVECEAFQKAESQRSGHNAFNKSRHVRAVMREHDEQVGTVPPKPDENQELLKAILDHLRHDHRQPSQGVGPRYSQQKPRNNGSVICWNCGQAGHYRRNCDKPRMNQGYGQPQNVNSGPPQMSNMQFSQASGPTGASQTTQTNNSGN